MYDSHIFLFSVLILTSIFSVFSGGVLIQSFKPGGQYVLVTFEDGPTVYTEKILDILKEKQARVTFFVQGNKLTPSTKPILQRMISERHEVASMGYDQDTFSINTLNSTRSNHIEKTSNIIKEMIGNFPSVIRIPYGSSNPDISRVVYKEFKLKTILWSIDSEDWEMNDSNKIVKNIMRKVKPGDIIVFRDTSEHTVQAIRLLIDELFKEGYECLTVSEMLSFPDDTPKR